MYSLCAILAQGALLEAPSGGFASVRRAPLEAGLSLVPLTESLVAEIEASGIVGGAGSVSGAFEFLSGAVEAWARSLSRGGEAAYIETEYLAGEGFERAALWSRGNIALGPLDGAGSINQVLRAMGVQAPDGTEAFEYVGLSRHRSVDEWASEATS